ncbi:MAG: phosphodiester glycosidase family protein [Clostridia bacterium]|nr:phosphodiester glycosidase family protein [Clostridia bacterium]
MKRTLLKIAAVAALLFAGTAVAEETGIAWFKTVETEVSAVTPVPTPEPTPEPVRSALSEEPCIEGPYDWSYADDTKNICIRKFSEKDKTWFVADIRLEDAFAFRAAYNLKGVKLSKMIEGIDAVLAINGDDFGVHKNGIIIRNGKLLREKPTNRHLLVLDEEGDLYGIKGVKRNEEEDLALKLSETGAWQVFDFGPVLVENGECASFPGSFDLISTDKSHKEPRTAIGMISPLHYVLIVVDGRQKGYSMGVSLQELQQMFVDLGAEFAFNLDGGGSTELWFQGKVLNRPSSKHERQISDIILF